MSYNLFGIAQCVREEMVRHPDRKLCEFASNWKMHRHTIERAIRIAYGITFRGLRQSLLLNIASERLHAEPDLTVKELSGDLGYKSPKAFTKAFRKFTGVTPTFLHKGTPSSRFIQALPSGRSIPPQGSGKLAVERRESPPWLESRASKRSELERPEN